jgi:hypothetical protein
MKSTTRRTNLKRTAKRLTGFEVISDAQDARDVLWEIARDPHAASGARVAAAKALLDDAKRTKPTVDNPEGEPDDPISKRAVEILSDLRRGKAN